MSASLLWLTDPLERLKLPSDSSLFLIHLAQRAGFECWITHQLRLVDSKLWADVAPVTVELESAANAETKSDAIHGDGSPWPTLRTQIGELRARPVRDFDKIINRLEPPLSEAYLQQCRLMMFHPQVLNSPVALQAYMEKFLPLFLDLGIATSTGPLLAPRDGVAKPLHLFGGVGVERVRAGQAVPDLFQDFAPDIAHGELRVLSLGDQFFGGLNKIPREGEFRSNSAHGSRMEFAPVSDELRQSCERILPTLRGIGVDFAAIDFIGAQIVEINITCPGLYYHLYHLLDSAERKRFEQAYRKLLASDFPANPFASTLAR